MRLNTRDAQIFLMNNCVSLAAKCAFSDDFKLTDEMTFSYLYTVYLKNQ